MDRNLFENVKKINVGATSQPVKDWKERWSTAVKPNTFCIVETAMGPKILYRNTNSQTFVTWPQKIEDNRIVGVPNRAWIKEAVAEYFADPKAFMTKVAECDVPGTMHPQETPDVDAEKNAMEDYSETEDPSKLKDKTKENDELKTREVKDKELEQKPPETKESKQTPRQKPRGYRIRESLRFCPGCSKTFRSNEAKCQCGNEKTEVLGEREYSDMVGSDKPVFKVEYIQDGQKKEDRVAAFNEDDAKRYVERMKRGAKATKAVKVGESKANEQLDGIADKIGHKESDFDPEQIKAGVVVEMEHTNDPEVAKKIAMDHLAEDSEYYTKLRKMEANEAAGKLDHDLTIKDGKGTCKCGKWAYENADAARVKANFKRHTMGKPNLFRSNTLGRDVTVPENESVSPSATIDQLADKYAQIIAADLPDGGTGDMRMEAVHTRTVDLWNDFNQLVAGKLKAHGVTIVGESKVNESQQRRARDQAVEIMKGGGVEAWGVDDYKIRVAMNEKVAIEMTVDGYYERQQTKTAEGKVPDDADPEDKKIQKLTEGILELVGELEGVSVEDQDALRKAVESGSIPNEWPTEDEMIDQLSALEDIVDPEGLDADIDVRTAWLKYVAVPKAISMAESVTKTDESNLNEPAGFESCVERGGRVRTVTGPDAEHGLKAGEYVKYCYIGGKSFRGEVETKKSESKVAEQGPVSAPGQMPPIPNKPAPGQKSESPEEKKKREALVSAAAKAVEAFGDDELEAYAEQIKKRQQGHK